MIHMEQGMSTSERIAIAGVGLMGRGIAHSFAAAGHAVSLFDPDAGALTKASTWIADSLHELGCAPLTPDQLTLHTSLAAAVSAAGVVFECAPERLEVKQRIFAELGRCAPPRAILASNTSVIPIGRIAENLDCAERMLGTHWWNPAHLIPLVEVVPSTLTEPSYVDATMQLLKSIGKSPVRLTHDTVGFVGNRLQFALWREAQALVAEGVCDAVTLDDIVKTSFGPRLAVLGPMENADLIGLDLALDITRVVAPALNDAGTPNPLLERLVADGRLGFKTGSGFRDWTPESIAECRRRLASHLRAAFGTTR
jgi:3-hydroxybutyryl-CoA dehydrogenase